MTKKIRIWKKITRNKILFALFLISLMWSASLFIVPFMVPEGTVKDLDGFANRVDFPEVWQDMPAFPGFIYTIGDAQCHQKSYRSFSLNGNQMPVDARVSAIYIAMTVGLFTAILAKPSYDATESFISVFPNRIKRMVHNKNWYDRFVWLMLIILITPMGLDGSIQLVTSYESTNLMRVFTGSLAGWVLGLLIGVMITSISELKGGKNDTRHSYR